MSHDARPDDDPLPLQDLLLVLLLLLLDLLAPRADPDPPPPPYVLGVLPPRPDDPC